jgi:SET domain-containing protein
MPSVSSLKDFLWLLEMYEVRPSPIHGQGLFATQDIKAGVRLADFNGKEMTLRDFKEKYGTDTRFCYSMRRLNHIIDGKTVENPSRYCNESATPNVCLKKRGLYTCSPVKAGEELFLSYPKDYPRDYDLRQT